MPKKFFAVTIVRAVFDGERRDIAPGAEIPEGIAAETLDELKQLGAVREEVVEAPAPVELTGDGSGEAPPEVAAGEQIAPAPVELTGDGSGEAPPEVAAGEQIAQATDGGPNPDAAPDAADKPARGKK